MFADWITLFHFSVSAAKYLAAASGDPVISAAPNSRSRSWIARPPSFVFTLERNETPDRRVDATAVREAVREESAYRYLIHDRDSIVATRFDNSVRALGLKVLRTSFRSPKANSNCERLIGTIRRELPHWTILV